MGTTCSKVAPRLKKKKKHTAPISVHQAVAPPTKRQAPQLVAGDESSPSSATFSSSSSSLSPLFIAAPTDAITTTLQTYYRSKDQLPGLVSSHSQPISDINLSIIELSPQLHRLQDAKENKQDVKDDKTKQVALAQYEAMHQVRHPIAVTDIFDKAPNKEGKLESRSTKRLLVLGAPGVGKTTMSQYIANQWALGKLWLGKFDYLFWLPLRHLLHEAIDKQPSPNLAHFIHRQCLRGNPTIPVDAVQKQLADKPSRILMLLDGYDEVAHLLDEPNHPIAMMLEQALQAEYVILTSRPYQLQNLPLTQFDCWLENTGFTDNNIESYVIRYFASVGPAQTSQGTALLSFLKGNLSIWETAHIPINLALICEIWLKRFSALVDEKVNSSIIAVSTLHPDLSMTGLYQQITLFLLKHYLEKQDKKPLPELPLKWEAAWVEKEAQIALAFLSELAFMGLASHQIQLSPALQQQVADKFVNLEDSTSPFQLILQSGFLRRISNDHHLKEIDKPHYFIHLTFQEYLAAYYVITCLKRETSTKEHQDALTWLQAEKYNSRYQTVLGFMVGILSFSEANATNNITLQFFWQSLLSDPLDMTGRCHIRLIIRCLEEARQDSRIPHYTQLLTEIGQWLRASCSNLCIQEWLIPIFRSAPWIVKQMTSLAEVLAHYQEGAVEAKKEALRILGELGAVIAVPRVISLLITALHNEGDEIRETAVETIGRLGSTIATPEVFAVLIKMLRGTSYWVKEKAAKTLIYLGPAAATSEVLTALLTM